MWNDVMSTAETEKLSPVTKAWQEAFGGQHTLVALKSHVIPIGLCIVVWQLYSHSLAPLACHFRDDARLLSLWPLNLIYVDQLATSNYSPLEICWLFAVTSTTSAVWLCWLAWRVGFEIFRSDVVYVPGGTKILLQKLAVLLVLFALVLLLHVLVLGQGFAPDSRLYGLTLKSGIGTNAFEIVFVFESFFFLTLGFTVEAAGLFARYVFLAIRHRLPD
jgi:hypothetical protein